MASKAPKTLKRFLPAGALIKIRVNDHRYPRNADKTKWAASTKRVYSDFPNDFYKKISSLVLLKENKW